MSISLYHVAAGMANPSKGSWKTSTPAVFSVPSLKPTVMKHANLQSMFTEYLTVRFSMPISGHTCTFIIESMNH